MNLYPIAILLVGMSLQGLFLFSRLHALRFGAAEWISGSVFAGSAVSLLALIRGPQESIQILSLLEDLPLLRLPRAALFIAAFLISRAIVSSKELPQERKPEVLFLLTFAVIFSELLLLSQNILLSVLLLISISWIGSFFSGLAYRGRSEGEAMLKGWVQGSLVMSLGLGSVLVLLWISGGAGYDAVAKGLAEASPLAGCLGVLSLFLPYFLSAGLFPFHFLPLDRDQGVPWSIQLIFTVLLQGSILLALWSLSVDVLHVPGKLNPFGLNLLQVASMVGGFWMAIFAVSQKNAKRLYSSLIAASWALALAAGCNPTELSASTLVYAFASIFLWSSLLGFTWSRLQEWAKTENIADVLGVARRFRTSGLFLLIALSAAVGVPGSSGLPVSFLLLASMIEQKSVLFLILEMGLMALVLLGLFRVASDLLFRGGRQTQEVSAVPLARYAALDYVGVIGLTASILILGIAWNRVFAALSETAKLFLN